MKKADIPKIGKTYKFYDDGKIRKNRQYDATVLRLIITEEAKKIFFDITDEDDETVESVSLYEIWQKQVKQHVQTEGFHVCVPDYVPSDNGDSWLYSKETDYFVECSIPEYDVNTIWFVRTVEGEWFSLEVQWFWQCGILDVDGELTKLLN